MFKKLLFILVLSISATSIAQIVNIPDANFKACLVANTDINTNNDSEIQVSEALNYSGDIICGGLNISSVVGVEAFTNATGASFNNNEIASIDISQNSAFTFISVSNNNLTNLDVTSNSNLISINCGQNQLSSLDVSNNPLLFNLNIRINNIAAINVSNLPALGRFDAAGCNISSIDFTNNPLLEELNLTANDITTLNLSQNNNLEIVRLEQVQNLTSISFANGVPLRQLFFSEFNLPNFNFNQLTTLEVLFLIDMPGIEILDVSNLSQIETLGIFEMPDLTALNIDNANYANGFVVLTDNFMLNCVEVDTNIDLNNLPADWDITPVPSITYDCGLPAPIVNIPDTNFKMCLLADTAINTNGDGEIQVTEAENFTGLLTCQMMGIVNTTGLEAFVNVRLVQLRGNLINTIFTSNNAQLEFLSLYDNPISTLDVSANTELTNLSILETNIETIDLSNNSLLLSFEGSTTELSSIDFSSNPLLESISISRTNISTIDLSMLPNLTYLNCGRSEITELDVSNNPNLEILYSEINFIETLDLSNNPSLIEVFAFENPLENIILSSGNNSAIQLFIATLCPDLVCVEVDTTIDPQNPPVDWSIDATATYSYDCELLGVNDFALNEIKIFPNPTKGIANISASVNIQEIKISNLQGQVILTQTQPQLDISTFSSGIYFITLKDDTGATYLKKIVKE